MKNKYEARLGTERMLPLVFKMALPAVAAQFVNLLYNIVDRIYIGHIPEIGTNALAGIGGDHLHRDLDLLFLRYRGSGRFAVSGYRSRAGRPGTGRKNSGKWIYIAYPIYYIHFTHHLYLHGTDPAFYRSIKIYVRICGGLSLYLFTGHSVCRDIHGLECLYQRTRASVYRYVLGFVGALLNIVLDPIFIFWLDMGVKGAALATILSQACSAIWVLSFLFSRRASLPLERRYMRLDRRIVLSMFALGISPFIMASTESLVGFVLNSSLKNFGDIYVSALAILQSAMQFASVPLTGFAQGFVPIISYNYGHGDKQRVKDCFRIVLIVMFSFNLILMLFMILFPSTVASAFTSDEELIDTVRWVMPIFLAGMTIFGLQRACQNMFVALGQAKISIFIALLRKVILLIPLALLLPHFMGVTGVYAAEAVSDATAAICCTLLFIWKFPKILGKIKQKEERAAQ